MSLAATRHSEQIRRELDRQTCPWPCLLPGTFAAVCRAFAAGQVRGSDPRDAHRRVTSSTDSEAGFSGRVFVEHVDGLHLRAARAFAAEVDESLDGFRVALEHPFDCAVRTVRDPAVHVALLRQPSHRVAEEHALHAAANDDATADHTSYSRRVELAGILARRRMVRAYDPEPVPRDAIERIVSTVRRAPSAGFSQGQRLLVVTDAGTRHEIAQLLGEREWVSQAPVLIAVGIREDDYHERYRKPDKLVDGEEIEWPIPYWHFDAGAAAMLILLAAIDEGYAAGLFGVFAEAMEPFKELLHIPEDVAVACCITIGKAADDSHWDAVTSRLTQARRPVDDLVHWERWR
jgi:FMN reductase [NAD(P)H]